MSDPTKDTRMVRNVEIEALTAWDAEVRSYECVTYRALDDLDKSPAVDVGHVLTAIEDRARLLNDLDRSSREVGHLHRASVHLMTSHAFEFCAQRAQRVGVWADLPRLP